MKGFFKNLAFGETGRIQREIRLLDQQIDEKHKEILFLIQQQNYLKHKLERINERQVQAG